MGVQKERKMYVFNRIWTTGRGSQLVCCTTI